MRPPGAARPARIGHAVPSAIARIVGLVRLVHPFPSVLDGLVVAVVALVAAGDLLVAARLGLSMTLLQFAIGAVNDLVDAPRDAGRRHGKPLPLGLVSPAAARWLAGACVGAALLLALPSGIPVVLLACVGLGVGLGYDLAAKGTAFSWAPFAIGIPLLPVYGWFGATGSLPPVFLALVPIAALEGAALAIANALVDVERDRDAGTGSVAIRLGAVTSGVVVVALQLLVALLAIGTASAEGAPGGWLAAVILTAAVPVSGAVVGGIAAVRAPRWRELAWEAQAIGAGLLAVAWLGSLSASGGMGAAGGI